MAGRVDYVSVFRDHYAALIVATVLGCVLGYGLASAQQAEYTAVNSTFVSTRAGSTATDLFQGGTFAQGRVASYAQLVTSRAVLGPAAEALDYEGGFDGLEKVVTATTDPSTVIIDISATSPSPDRAAEIANEVADEFAGAVGRLELPNAAGRPTVEVSSISEAEAPDAPSSPKKKLWTVVFGLIALGATWFFLLARSLWSTAIRTADQVEEIAQVPLLGTVSRVSRMRNLATATIVAPASVIAESYRQIRTNLRFLEVDRTLKRVAVVSGVSGEGKTTAACNLSEALSEGGARVLLVDADLRRPSVGDYMGTDSSVGLSSVLSREVEAEEAIVKAPGAASLWILPSGPVPPNPSELIGSEAMERLLDGLAESWDFVVVDTAPMLAVADAMSIAAWADVAILVVRQQVAKRDQVAQVARQLAQLPNTETAAVLNCVSTRRRTQNATYQYYGTYTQQREQG